MTLAEELALVACIQAGERETLGVLWDDINPKLYGYLINVLRDSTLADDILQETWLKAIKGLPKFQSRGVRFSAWVFAIARNECRQAWRKTSQTSSVPLPEETATLHSDRGSSQEKLIVQSILTRLSPEDQEILRLRYLGDLTFRELATILGISTVSARVRVHRALNRAHQYLTL